MELRKTPFKSRQLLSQSPAKYHVFKDGTKYFCENRKTGKIPITDTDAFEVFDALFKNYLEDGDKVFIENGDYSQSDTPVLTTSYNTIEGEGKATILRPPTGKYAIQIGDGTANKGAFTTLKSLRIQPSSVGAGNGFYGKYARGLRANKLMLLECAVGGRIEYSSGTLLRDLFVSDFTSKGLYYPTSVSGLITDQSISQCSIVSGESGTIGVDIEEKVNGIRLEGLTVGSDTTGVDVGLRFTGSYSGLWLNNVVIDQLVGTGIEILDSINHPCADLQFNNVWVQSCGEHGMKIEGHIDRMIESCLFSNMKLKNNGKAGLIVQNAQYMLFQNSEFRDNANDDIADNDYMTNILIEDKVGLTSFIHCLILQNQNLTNRKRPARIITRNGSYACVYFRDCYVKDFAGDELSRIGLYRNDVGEELYAYGLDCAIKNSSVTPNDTFFVQEAGSPQAPNMMDEVEIKLNPALGW